MTNQQILEKAIQKAVDGGWSFALLWAAIEPDWKWMILDGDETIEITDPHDRISQGANRYWTIDWYRFIFNHDFAKALWGEFRQDWREYKDLDTGETYFPLLPPKLVNLGWEHHLQKMVIAKDPIKYLGENI
jgi:hypothetical protein